MFIHTSMYPNTSNIDMMYVYILQGRRGGTRVGAGARMGRTGWHAEWIGGTRIGMGAGGSQTGWVTRNRMDGARHRERRAPTRVRAAGPHTEGVEARHRERRGRGPIQRAPGPDTESAWARYRERRESAGAQHRLKQKLHKKSRRSCFYGELYLS